MRYLVRAKVKAGQERALLSAIERGTLGRERMVRPKGEAGREPLRSHPYE